MTGAIGIRKIIYNSHLHSAVTVSPFCTVSETLLYFFINSELGYVIANLIFSKFAFTRITNHQYRK